jgi:hypothetical protein
VSLLQVLLLQVLLLQVLLLQVLLKARVSQPPVQSPRRYPPLSPWHRSSLSCPFWRSPLRSQQPVFWQPARDKEKRK